MGIGARSEISFLLARPWTCIIIAIFAELGRKKDSMSGAATGSSRHSSRQTTTMKTNFAFWDISAVGGIAGGWVMYFVGKKTGKSFNPAGQVQVGDDGDGHEQLRLHHEGAEQHHGAVGAADNGHRHGHPDHRPARQRDR